MTKVNPNSGNETKLDHEITLNVLESIINSIEKVKPGILLSSMCMFPESNGTKS